MTAFARPDMTIAIFIYAHDDDYFRDDKICRTVSCGKFKKIKLFTKILFFVY